MNDGKLADNDGIIVWNYRPDRLREMFTAITNSESIGKALNECVVRNKEKYKYHKLS